MTNSITDRVDSVATGHSQVKELKKEVGKIQSRRENAEQKNRASERLQSTLEDFRNDFETMRKWQFLADEMRAEYSLDGSDDLIRSVEEDLQSMTTREFDDFEDASEIRELDDNFDSHQGTLDDIQSDIQQSVEAHCEGVLEELNTVHTVLRIPDVGSKEDEDLVGKFQAFLESIRDGTLPLGAADRYRDLADAYADIDIGFDAVQEDYGLGDEAMDELRRLLENERVTLNEIDEEVLKDLKQLPEFSRLLTIQFDGGQ